jgi:hypothetical protein
MVASSQYAAPESVMSGPQALMPALFGGSERHV